MSSSSQKPVSRSTDWIASVFLTQSLNVVNKRPHLDPRVLVIKPKLAGEVAKGHRNYTACASFRESPGAVDRWAGKASDLESVLHFGQSCFPRNRDLCRDAFMAGDCKQWSPWQFIKTFNDINDSTRNRQVKDVAAERQSTRSFWSYLDDPGR